MVFDKSSAEARDAVWLSASIAQPIAGADDESTNECSLDPVEVLLRFLDRCPVVSENPPEIVVLEIGKVSLGVFQRSPSFHQDLEPVVVTQLIQKRLRIINVVPV